MGNGWLLQYLYAAPPILVALAMMTLAIRAGPAFWARWNESRRDLSRAKAGDWSRLRGEIARVDERCRLIEEREQECQRQLTDALHRIGELEGYNIGRGEAKQDAQRMLSEERQIDANKRKDKP